MLIVKIAICAAVFTGPLIAHAYPLDVPVMERASKYLARRLQSYGAPFTIG
jgi:hypothetical protein